jgi:6-phospho 3-hexuloisomerase
MGKEADDAGYNAAGNAAAVTRNLSLVRNEIAEAAAGIDEQQLAVLASQILQADRVFVAGAGRSGLVLKMAAMRLMHLGLTVHVAGETTTPAIRSGDLLLVASGSGSTPGAVRSAETAAAAGARIAVVTTDAQSPLAETAGAVVITTVQRFPASTPEASLNRYFSLPWRPSSRPSGNQPIDRQKSSGCGTPTSNSRVFGEPPRPGGVRSRADPLRNLSRL